MMRIHTGKTYLVLSAVGLAIEAKLKELDVVQIVELPIRGRGI